jgi:hypothetical protein
MKTINKEKPWKTATKGTSVDVNILFFSKTNAFPVLDQADRDGE